jgi:hypothetical protein
VLTGSVDKDKLFINDFTEVLMSRADYAGLETVLKDDYLGNLLKIPQQSSTRLFGGFASVTVEGQQLFVDGIAPVDYRIDNSQNAASVGASANFFRRKLDTDRMIVEIDHDSHWFRKTTDSNPSSLITPEMMKASYRFLDKVGINAAIADVKYGQKGESTLTFANDKGIVLDATGGITDALLRKINHRFTGTEVIEPDGMADVKFITTEDEQYDMTGLTTLISGDFQRFFPQNAAGRPNGSGYAMAHGLRMVSFGAQAETGKMLNEASGVRDCLALANDALIYGQASDGVQFDIIELKETKISTVRLRLTLTAGAVRSDGRKVIKFQTTVKDPSVFYA